MRAATGGLCLAEGTTRRWKTRLTTSNTSSIESPARGAPGWPSPEPAGGLGVKGGTPPSLFALANKSNQSEFSKPGSAIAAPWARGPATLEELRAS
jgi:hypothetical protein